MPVPLCPPVACIEVGGGGVETVILGRSALQVVQGARPPAGVPILLAVPGLLDGHRVVAASNLGWVDVDPSEALGLDRAAELVINDAEAAALGESALRGGVDLTFVGLGTGVGGAVVAGEVVVGTNLLGHGGSYGSRACRCSRTGCLETVAAGWALPDPLPHICLPAIADAVARAVRSEPLVTAPLVVIAGGMARRHPALVEAIARVLPECVVEPSAAPPEVKSATAWGLAFAYERVREAVA